MPDFDPTRRRQLQAATQGFNPEQQLAMMRAGRYHQQPPPGSEPPQIWEGGSGPQSGRWVRPSHTPMEPQESASDYFGRQNEQRNQAETEAMDKEGKEFVPGSGWNYKDYSGEMRRRALDAAIRNAQIPDRNQGNVQTDRKLRAEEKQGYRWVEGTGWVR